MASRSLPGLVLEEAAEVLGELGAWLRLADACPKCAALQGCSHQAGCPLGRVARLRCLLGSEDQHRREDELVALRRERGELVTSAGDRLFPAPLGSAGMLASAPIELPLATPVPLEPGAPTVPDPNTVPTLARATAPNAHVPRRLLLRLLRRLRGRLRAAQRRRRVGRLVFASPARDGSALVLRAALGGAPRDDGRRVRREARVTYPVSALSLLVLLASQPTREVQPWPSLASLERATRLHRRSVIRLLRELEARGVLLTRPRGFAAGKAGAP
jgi:hypothetical protein